jgi:hypothetical protein
MTKFTRALVLAAFAAVGMSSLAAAEKPEPVKEEKKSGELLKTVIDVKYVWDDNKKGLTITATGQVPTGGWKDAKLVRRVTKDAPKDGVYEFDLTAVRPTGIVTQALSKVTAIEKWMDPPADLKAVKVYGAGDGAKTVKIEK